MSADRDLIAIAREIRDELRLIRKALEAANANDPIAAMERALDDFEVADQGGNVVETVTMPYEAGIPPEEAWRLS